MTNWPNIQEYRNFEAKFFDNSKEKNLIIDSAEEDEVGSVERNEYKDKIYSDNSYNNVTTNHSSESKTVRCVIRKDFEEAFKKLDRGDGLALICESVRPKTQETSPADQSIVDKVRLQNHLKWKKQKEEEYFQKKEAERIAQLKKKEEESRLERLKKQKEKERTEKLKEWQEHKAREKEEKKREKMVMKELEEELKGVTFTVDKEKLIAEWVKIKNRQKQMEAEKKAEMLKKEEENRALRQNLAELSYKQWKERIKGRMMTLPKNGYQIFGPKPVPVVKEDWNHNFANSSPRSQIHQDVGLRNTKSNTSTFTLRPTVKEFENLTKESFYLGDLKKRTKSFCQLKTGKTGSNSFCESEALRKREQYGMPLKELQPGTIDHKKNWSNNLMNGIGDKRHRTVCNSASQDLSEESQTFSKNMRKHEETFKQILSNDYSSLLGNLLGKEGGDQNRCLSKSHGVTSSTLLDEISESLGLANKKKLDLYINANPYDVEEEEEEFPKKIQKKKTHVTKSNDIKFNTEKKKETGGSKDPNKKILSKEKCSGQSHITTDPVSLRKERKTIERCANTEQGTKQKTVESQKAKDKTYRRSRSYDKPIKKCFNDAEKVKGCSSSMSFTKVRGAGEDPCKRLKLTKSKTSACQRKSRRRSKPNTPDVEPPRRTGDKKAAVDSEAKPRKKLKKRNAFLSKSLSFSDSPYSIKKNKSKSLEKVKGSRPKNLSKDGGTKTSESGQCRKLASTKV